MRIDSIKFLRLTSTTIGLLLLAGVALAAPLPGEQDEERIVKKVRIECEGDDCDDEQRIVRKVRIHCDGDDCDEHTMHHGGEGHKFAWFSGDGPGKFSFRTHLGGGFLGVQLAELTPELRVHFGVEESAGVMISKVVEESPAARAGLAVGDIITRLDETTIGSGRELAHGIRGKKAGESVLLEVWRDGTVRKMTVAVEERKPNPHAMDYAFVMECDDEQGDCSFGKRHLEHMKHMEWDHDGELACEGDGPCLVSVVCEDDGECVCTINDEPADCDSLPGGGR